MVYPLRLLLEVDAVGWTAKGGVARVEVRIQSLF